jgi:hypothetical protein
VNLRGEAMANRGKGGVQSCFLQLAQSSSLIEIRIREEEGIYR